MHKPAGTDAAEGARPCEAAENYPQRAAEVNFAARCVFTARGLKMGRAFVGKTNRRTRQASGFSLLALPGMKALPSAYIQTAG